MIDKIKLRCTAISSTGTWSNSDHEWTDYTPSDSPSPATDTADALCGSNRFVAGFNVYRRQITTGQTVVAKVALKCRQANSQSVATGTDETPEAGAPATNQVISNTRTVTFTWQANQAANAGYQLVMWRTGQQSGYSVYNPTAALATPHQSIQIPAGTTSYTYNLPPGLTAVQWGVYACANFPNKGRRCSLGTQPRGFTVPAFFGFAMAPTFRHERCANCHAVVPDNFVKDTATDTDNGLPSNHTTVNASTNCATCHTNNLLPTAGTINPGWHAPSGMDFRNKNIQELCSMAKRGAGGATSANAVRDHLTQDKLILWVVGDGRVPQNRPTLQTAPPETTPHNTNQEIQAWQQLVNRWVDYGMPCN